MRVRITSFNSDGNPLGRTGTLLVFDTGVETFDPSPQPPGNEPDFVPFPLAIDVPAPSAALYFSSVIRVPPLTDGEGA